MVTIKLMAAAIAIKQMAAPREIFLFKGNPPPSLCKNSAGVYFCPRRLLYSQQDMHLFRAVYPSGADKSQRIMGLPIDPDAFFAHQDEKYTEHLGHIMARQDNWRSPSKLKKFWPEDWIKQGGSD